MRMLNGFELAAVAGGAGGARGPQESLISTPIIIYQADGGGGGCQEPGGSVGDFGSADRDLSALSGFGCVQNVGWQSEVGKWLAGSLGWDMLKDWYSKNVGVAGSNPSANENDNGGTSFGTGVCNTFGCP